jgi:hypothetical protein
MGESYQRRESKLLMGKLDRILGQWSSVPVHDPSKIPKIIRIVFLLSSVMDIMKQNPAVISQVSPNFFFDLILTMFSLQFLMYCIFILLFVESVILS